MASRKLDPIEGPMRNAALVAFATSFGTTCATLPIILKFARRRQIYDPSGPLKIHAVPTPRLGGVAIAGGLTAGILVAAARVEYEAVFLSLSALWLAGLIDDVFGLSPLPRLIIQAATAVPIWLAGWSVRIGPAWLNLLLTVLFIVFFINALNMLDGADGLAAGVATIIALAFILLTSQRINPWASVLDFSFLGSCIGFLLFNFPPAKIFMGDSGSTVLGFALSVMTLDFYRHCPPDHGFVLVPLLFAGVPLLDAAFAVVRRLLRRTSPFQGDREHFYDLLLQSGWSSRKVALASYVATVLFVILGFVCRFL